MNCGSSRGRHLLRHRKWTAMSSQMNSGGITAETTGSVNILPVAEEAIDGRNILPVAEEANRPLSLRLRLAASIVNQASSSLRGSRVLFCSLAIYLIRDPTRFVLHPRQRCVLNRHFNVSTLCINELLRFGPNQRVGLAHGTFKLPENIESSDSTIQLAILTTLTETTWIYAVYGTNQNFFVYASYNINYQKKSLQAGKMHGIGSNQIRNISYIKYYSFDIVCMHSLGYNYTYNFYPLEVSNKNRFSP